MIKYPTYARTSKHKRIFSAQFVGKQEIVFLAIDISKLIFYLTSEMMNLICALRIILT